MEDFDPGDPQGSQRTSTTHDQHDPGKAKAFEGKDGPNRKEIGAKLIKNNKNGQIDTCDIASGGNNEDDQKMTRAEIEQAKDVMKANIQEFYQVDDDESEASEGEEDDAEKKN